VRRHQLAQMLIIGAIASAIGVVIALLIDWFPPQATDEAAKIDTLYDVLLIVSVPVFVLVLVVVLYSVWKFRMRPGEELKDGPPIHGNTALEIIWTAVPAILITGLVIYAYAVLHDIEKAKANTLEIGVTGQQFTWSFQYKVGGKTVNSPQLYLPKGRPVRLNIKAVDVIHSFWVPAFRLKKDAVPGITTDVRFTPDKIGTYPVVCAELCGIGHATMRQTAHILQPAAYQAWLEKKAAPPAAAGGGGGGTAAGKAVFAANGCASCHTLADAGAGGTVGPDLDKALKGKDKAFIQESITAPDKEIAKGYPKGVMPANFGQTISKDELTALVDYLAQVTK
jgi:cytochrome c oxidase subunit II